MKEFIKGLETHIIDTFIETESETLMIQVTDDRRDLINYLYIKDNLIEMEKNIKPNIGCNEISFIWNPSSNLHELYIER